MKKYKKIKTTIIACFLATICCTFFASLGIITASAVSSIGADGRYGVSYEFGGQSGIGGQMLKKYFDSTAEVEKIGNKYYLSITQLSSSMENLSLNLVNGMQVGYRITESDGNRTTYSYTLSEESISKELPFSVYVSARDETFHFTIKLKFDTATFLGDADKTAERPAEFVPTLSTTAGDLYEAQKGQTFVLPNMEATLGEECIAVSVRAYYVQNNQKTEVAVTDGKISLDHVGEYHVVYRARSERYLTSLGNPTYVEKDIVIISQAEGGELVKVNDVDGILPNDYFVIASQITDGSELYRSAAEKMLSITNRFQVFGVELVESDGNAVIPTGNIVISIKADFTYDRNDIEVYHLGEDGVLTKLSSENGGSYVKVTTDKTGTFIVCVPGVAFVMPMWVYLLIAVGGLAIISVAIIVSVVLVKRKRKK